MNNAQFQLFDVLPAHIEDALTASIKRFGVLVPVTVDQNGTMLDGHHRARIAELLGVKYDRLVRHCADDDERREIARTLNADRRQLTEEQRRAVVVELRQAGHSLRAIAGALGTSEPTVRRDLDRAEIASGDAIELPDRITRQGGGSYPARRPPRAERIDEYESSDVIDMADGEDDYVSPLPDGPRYCKYCYEEHELDMGDDGSLIVCSGCGAGLAPWDEAVEAGGYDEFVEKIEREFYERQMRRPQVLARDDREQQRAQTALVAVGDTAPAKTLDLKRVERIAREHEATRRRIELVQNPPEALSRRIGDAIDLRIGDFRSVFDDVESGTVDAIITDPPYPREFWDLYGPLGELAARLLHPGGILAVMTGTRLDMVDHVDAAIRQHMTPRHRGIYLTPGPRWRDNTARVATGYKPILIYTHPDADTTNLPWILDDVFASIADDKAHHHWGQSESGMASIVERLTEPGHLVCDPFTGGGTTAVVCQSLGRAFLGCDVDPLAVDTTRGRLQ